jgi:DHA1 family inner membrane transport protein
MPLSLLALAIAAFGIGTTEFVIMGLLPSVARDLGVNIPQAGYLVSGYALGVVIGAPIVAMLTVRLPRKPALLGMIGVFIVGNVLCALAPNYALLLCARIVTAFCHGAFFGIGAVVAADLVPQKERARAIALMFAGLTLANVLGVPAGTALGESYGWRSTFWAVVAIGIVAMAALAFWLPAKIPMKRANLVREFRVLGNAQVLLAMLISILGSASLFSVFTYIAPFLEHVTGFRSATVTMVLLVFGVGLTLGNMLGGRLADWKLMPSLLGVLVLLAAILTLFTFTSHSQAATVATIFVWGVAAFALVPLLQMRIVDKAASAPNLASTLNQGAFNLGNAGGAWLGGASLGIGVGYDALPWLGAGVALLALATTVLSEAMDRRPRATYALR